MAGIDKQESILLIEHAISGFKNLGQKQSAVAKLLGIPESRISEAKTGAWRMLPSHKKLIIDKFGGPRQGPGHYVQTELYSNVDEFIEQFHVIGDKRFYQRLASMLSDKGYISFVLNCVANADNYQSKESEKITGLNKFIESEDFKQWFENADIDHPAQIPFHRLKGWSESGVGCWDERSALIAESLLYRVGLLKFKRCHDYALEHEHNENLNLVELVLSGNRILQEDLGATNNPRLKSDACFNNKFKKPAGHVPDVPKATLNQDLWNRVYLHLYLSESMRYHALIILEPEDYNEQTKRTIVIEDLDQTVLYEDVDKLRQFFGGERSFGADIKREIAANGGYVAGARRL